ncbi:MAG TPA: trypsin-like peptidase domain-containing protein [Candidatus Fimivivens sp.]|nr:trypsin-like peptidase domain-containing protein [Candidatus Fimivivens sp.]
MEHEAVTVSEPVKPTEGGNSNPVHAIGRHGGNVPRTIAMGAVVIALSFVSGMVGSSFERRLPGYAAKFPFLSSVLKTVPVADPDGAKDPIRTTPSDSGDETLVGIVDRSSSSVVSVVATKEVRAGNLGNIPFFFGPFGFGTGTGNGDGNDGVQGRGTTEKRKIGSGTGFFVTSDGLVVTNKHVISDQAADYEVVLPGGKEYPARVLAVSPNQDIAVLKIDGSGFPSLPLGDSSSLRVGQTAIAIGNPLGEFPNSVSRGIISGLNRDVTAGSGYGDSESLSDIIQTDAAINPGNSGGPLLDLSGNVIGINVAVAQGAENIGFAIPIDQVKRVIDEVKTTGKITTPYLGVRYAVIDESAQKDNGLPYAYGALVVRGAKATDMAVIPGSPADKAGIVENDIILEIDGTKVDTDHPLGNIVAEHNVGDTLTLKVWHKGETKDVHVTLTERPQ